MKTYPKILGYLGVLPFLLSLIGVMFFNGHPILGQMFLVFQLSYASMIVSFLGGTHWPPEYMAFRLRITLIVSAILFITFGVTLS